MIGGESETLYIARLRRWASTPESPAEPVASTPQPATPRDPANKTATRLVIDSNPPQATLDGKAYSISADAVDFLSVLIGAAADDDRDDWVAGRTLDMRADRVKKNLPDPLRNLVESSSGKGYRISRQILA